MKILWVCDHMFSAHTWSQECIMLLERGIDLFLFSQLQSAEKAMAFVEKERHYREGGKMGV